MSFPDTVRNALWGIVYRMNENPAPFVKNPGKDFTRTRKMTLSSIILFLISMGTGCVNHELVKFYDFEPKDIPTASAFIQQRAKVLPCAFRHVLEELNNRFQLKKFRKKYFLLAADGCEFAIARNPQDASTYNPPSGRSKAGFNSVHTVSLYDLISKRYLDAVIQPGRLKNEFRGLCDLVKRYAYGGKPIIVADRGFSSYNVYAHIMEAGGFFAIRTKDINVKRILGMTGELASAIDHWTEVILSRTTAKSKIASPDLLHLYRHVCKGVPFDFINDESPEYRMRLRIVRFDLGNGNFENILTNLSDKEFTAADIREIYGMRWDQETSFRDLKQTIGTGNFHTKSPEYVEFEILTRMILYNFCTIITIEVPAGKTTATHEYKVNLSMAIKICVKFLQCRCEAANVNALVSKFILPVRTGRSYERRIRYQAPASFSYRFI